MSARVRIAAACVAILGVAVASCTLTTSLDGLTSEGSSLPDAGDAAAKADGDKTLPDTGSSSDTSTGTDAATPAFCVREPGHLFCSDFESGSVLDGKWEGTSLAPGSTLTREEGAAASGRGNLVCSTVAVTSGETHAVLIKNYTQSIKTMTLGAAVKLVDCSPSGAGGVSLMSFSAGPATDKWLASIVITPSGIVMNATKCPAGACTGTNFTLAVAPPANTWSRVVMSVDLVASTTTVTVDGKLALDKKPIAITSQNGNALINLGAGARAPSSACRIEYDDVTFDVQ